MEKIIKVRFSKVYHGSYEPYMFDYNKEFNHSGSFKTIKQIKASTGIKNVKDTGDEDFAITATGIKRLYKIYEGEITIND